MHNKYQYLCPMKRLEELLKKYDIVFLYLLLALQYMLLFLFPDYFGEEAKKHYTWLWFFDLFFAIPIAFLVFVPTKGRRIIVSGIILFAFILFFKDFKFNTLFLIT